MGIPGYPSTNHCSGMGLVFLSLQKLDLVMVSFLPSNHRQQLKMLVNRRRPVGDQCVLCSLRAPVWKAVNHFLLPDLTSPKKLWIWPKQNHYSMAEKLPEPVWKLFWSVYIIIFSYCWNVQLSDFTRVSRHTMPYPMNLGWGTKGIPGKSYRNVRGIAFDDFDKKWPEESRPCASEWRTPWNLLRWRSQRPRTDMLVLGFPKEINRGFYIRTCEY